jgi:hypothetical protein
VVLVASTVIVGYGNYRGVVVPSAKVEAVR